ncbi:MAG: hypothetical protein ACI4UL_08685 [Muribaculaceae bacterium]
MKEMFKAFFSMMQSPDEKAVASSATAEKSSAKNPTHGDVKRWMTPSGEDKDISKPTGCMVKAALEATRPEGRGVDDHINRLTSRAMSSIMPD